MACGGDGCNECTDGRFELTECPLLFVETDAWELIALSDLYAKGLPPVAGGSLDQTRIFNQACRFVWSEQRAQESEAMNG